MKAAELRAKSGETSNLEMITARSQGLEVKNQLQQTRADIGIFTRRFQALLNTSENLSPADTKLIRAGTLHDSTGISKNPSLGYINQQAVVARNEKNLERSRMMPDLSIGYFSQTIQGTQDVKGAPSVFGPGDRFNGLQAGISVPLWFAPYISKTRAARINENIARTDAEYYTSYLSGNLKSLYDEYGKYSLSVAFYETQALPEADLIIEQSTISYKAGALDYLDYIMSMTRALGIRQEHLNALNFLNQTLINIEYITGKTF
jgi:cobalt-zinc-cadmium resistance protein CzcA